MSGRRWLPYIALLAAAASLACGDTVGPTSPLGKRTTVNAPKNASFGRWILISGAWTCVAGCDDDGDTGGGAGGVTPKTDGLPSGPDTTSTFELPDFGG